MSHVFSHLYWKKLLLVRFFTSVEWLMVYTLCKVGFTRTCHVQGGVHLESVMSSIFWYVYDRWLSLRASRLERLNEGGPCGCAGGKSFVWADSVDAAARSLTRLFFPLTINGGGGKLSTDCSLGWNKLERRGALLSWDSRRNGWKTFLKPRTSGPLRWGWQGGHAGSAIRPREENLTRLLYFPQAHAPPVCVS